MIKLEKDTKDETREWFTTPIGEIAFGSCISEEDLKFGGYKVMFAMDQTDEKCQELMKLMQDKAEAAIELVPAKNKEKAIVGDPFDFEYEYDKEKKEQTDVKTGRVLFKFSTKFRPKVYDSLGKEIDEDVKVGYGTTGRLKVSVKPYYTPSTKLYGTGRRLNSIQVKDLKEYGSDGGFEPMED